jgi:hypothetical protein
MLRSTKEVLECTVFAQDGIFGTVDDFFFDDNGKVAKYVVIKTGDRLPDHKLMLPMAALSPDWIGGLLSMPFTRGQVLKKYVRRSWTMRASSDCICQVDRIYLKKEQSWVYKTQDRKSSWGGFIDKFL